MSISFSGLASGLDTTSWVESLVALKRAKVDTLQEQKENVLLSQNTLNSIKSFFSSFRSVIERVTDTKFNIVSMDLFAQNIATSANLSVVAASADVNAEEGIYQVLVDKLATNTQATSNYSYITTIIQTTTATNDSYLKHLGVTAGNISVKVGGIEYGVNISENDTIGSFCKKLQDIGVNASFNNNTGIFNMNINRNDIIDIDNTGICDALHLDGVNEGYATENKLEVENVETFYYVATNDTKLSELGVQNGTVTVRANEADYEFTVNEYTTLGSFIERLNSKNIVATLDETGVFTLSDAEIVDEGTTDILNALGLEVDIYSKTQSATGLKHEITVTETATATTDTLLKDIGTGTTIYDNQTVIVKNSNNATRYITLNTTSTVGDLLEGLRDAGLSATINSDGTVEISGGQIIGGSFDAKTALGLSEEAYSTSAISANSLKYDVTTAENATLSTKIVEDLGVKAGYFKVTDVDGNISYQKITSGETISDFIAKMSNIGVNASFDSSTGIMTIAGGTLETLTDAQVASLVSAGTIAEPTASLRVGSDLITNLFGQSIISADQTEVNSTSAKSAVLQQKITTTIAATASTALGYLGVGSSGTAILDVRGESRTINVTSTMTVQNLIDKLAEQGISSAWDESNSTLSLSNAAFTGGTSNIADALGMTSTITGRYVSSNALSKSVTNIVDATGSTQLSEFGITSSMSASDRTVSIYDANGNKLGSVIVTATTTLQELENSIDNLGISATLQNGVFTIKDGYIENSTLESSMGLDTDIASSYVLGSVMTKTTTVTVSGTSKLGDIIQTLGTTSAVSSGYNLSFNGKNIAVTADTTLDVMMQYIRSSGGTATLDANGYLTVGGGILTGSVATALGITSTTSTSQVSATGNTLMTNQEKYADLDTTFADMNIADTAYYVYNSLGNAIATVSVSSTQTIGQFFAGLESNGISGTISNGVINITSTNGNYINGTTASALGIGTKVVTTIISTTQQSSSKIMYSATLTATSESEIGEIWSINGSSAELVIKDKNSNQLLTTDLSAATTVEGLFSLLHQHGISGTINDGVISLYSSEGNYIDGAVATALGLDATLATSVTTTVAKSATSTAVVNYTLGMTAKLESTIADFVTLPTNKNIEIYQHGGNSAVGTITVTNTMTFQDLANSLAGYNITLEMSSAGVITLNYAGDYFADASSDMMKALKLKQTNGFSTVVGAISITSTSAVSKTITNTATSDTTLTSIVGSTLGSLEIYDDNGTKIKTTTLASTTTVKQFKECLSSYGITATLVDGVITLSSSNGNYIDGDLATKLGIESVTVNTGTTLALVNTSDTAIMVTVTVGLDMTSANAVYCWQNTGVAGYSTTLGDLRLGISNYTMYVHEGNGAKIATISVSSTTTMSDLMYYIDQNDFSSSLTNGILTVTSNESANDKNYLSGTLAEALGLTRQNATIVTTGSSVTSCPLKVVCSSVLVTETTLLSDIIHGSTYITVMSGSTKVATIDVSDYSTLGDLFDAFESYGINSTINNGVVSVVSTTGNYLVSSNLDCFGIRTITDSSGMTSSSAVTYTKNFAVDGSTLCGDFGLNTINLIQGDDPGNPYTKTFSFDANQTLQSAFDELNSYGVKIECKGGYFTYSNSSGFYISDNDLNRLFGIQKLSSSRYITIYSDDTITSSEAIKISGQTITENTTLSSLGMGSIVLNYQKANGTPETVQVFSTSGMTVANFIELLEYNGFEASLKDGKFTIKETLRAHLISSSFGSTLKLTGNTQNKTTSTCSSGSYASTALREFSKTIVINEYTTASDLGLNSWDFNTLDDDINGAENTLGGIIASINPSYTGYTLSLDDGRVFLDTTSDGTISCDYTLASRLKFGSSTVRYNDEIGRAIYKTLRSAQTTDNIDAVWGGCEVTISDKYGESRVYYSEGRTIEQFSGYLNYCGGISVSIDGDGKLTFISTGDSYVTDVRISGVDKVVAESYTTANVYTIKPSQTLNHYKTVTISNSTSFGSIFEAETSSSTITIVQNGTEYTSIVDTSTTVGKFLTWLNNHGIEASLNYGRVSISGSKNAYIKADVVPDYQTGNTPDPFDDLGISYGSFNLSQAQAISTDLTLGVIHSTFLVANSSDTYIEIYSEERGSTEKYYLSKDKTLGQVKSDLANGLYGINITISNTGIVEFAAQEGYYITSVGSAVADVFKISAGEGYTYKTVYDYYNVSDTNALTYKTTYTLSTTTTSFGSELGLTTDGYIYGVKDGQNWNIAVGPSTSFASMKEVLANYGITASVTSGKLTLTGSANSYITDMSNSLKTLFKVDAGQDKSYGEESVLQAATASSSALTSTTTTSINGTTTFANLGFAAADKGYITVVTNGTEKVVTVNSTTTMSDLNAMLTTLGAAIAWNSGKATIAGNGTTYIKGISDNIKTALKVKAGSGNTYTTSVQNGYVNNNSDSLSYTRTNLTATTSTKLSAINGYSNGNGQIKVHKSDGTYATVTLSSSDTVESFFNKISAYGLTGTINGDGIVTILGTGNVYLEAVSGGSNLLTAMKLSNVVENVTTATHNTGTNSWKQTITVNATGTTALKDVKTTAGAGITFNGSGKSYLTLKTVNTIGAVNNYTLTFSNTSTINDVIDALNAKGIKATLDTSGRFSVSSTTLSDFDMSGSIKDVLMGNYTKEHDTNVSNNVSMKLVEEKIAILSDSDTLSSLGINGGNINIRQNGINHTVNIDTSAIRTVGDFRNLLSSYGFSSYIDSEGRLAVTGVGDSSLSEIGGGSNVLSKFGLTNWQFNNVVQTTNVLTDKDVVTSAATKDVKLNELKNSAGTSLGITSGKMYVYQDGTRNLVSISNTETLESLANKLSQYGITMGVNADGSLYFDGNNNSYITTTGIASGEATNLLSKLGIEGNWSTRQNSSSKSLSYTQEEVIAADGSVKMVNLLDSSGNSVGITVGAYSVYKDGVKTTEYISADTSVNDFLATLNGYGFNATILSDGTISVKANGNTYIETSSTGNDSNVVDKLFSNYSFNSSYTSNALTISETTTETATLDTKLSEIKDFTFQEGYITVVKDGVTTDVYLSSDETVGSLINELALYGINASLKANGQLAINAEGGNIIKEYTGAGQASNLLDLMSIDDDSDWTVLKNYNSSPVEVIDITTTEVSATRETKLSDLGVTTGEYYIYNNGVRYTALISNDETIGSLVDTLRSFGIQAALTDDGTSSTLKILGSGDSYLTTSNTTGEKSNVVSKLFTSSNATYEYTGDKQTSTTITSYTSATEDTLLSYYGVSNGNIAVTIDGLNSNISVSADETIGSLLNKFNSLGIESTISDGNILLQSGFKDFTIQSSGTTSNVLTKLGLVFNDDLGGYVSSTAVCEQTTTTVETRTLSAAAYVDDSTKLGSLAISNGTFTVYKNGQKATLNIDSEYTFGDLRSQLSAVFSDVDMKYEDGYLTIYSTTDGAKLEAGSTTDSSNLKTVLGLNNDESGAIKSARALYKVNNNTKLTEAGNFRKGNITEGTFKIGDVTFEITENTTMQDIISQINTNDDAMATAYWDSIGGKLVIQSRNTGSAMINIEAGTSNFTDIMGLTESTWNPDGTMKTTRILADTQELGGNARFSINGTYYSSTSNKVDSSVTRIEGLTLDLKGVSEGQTVEVKVERNKENLADAVSEVVDAYNTLIENVDAQLKAGNPLASDSSLKLLRDQVRSIMMNTFIGGGVFKNMDAIGIGYQKASNDNISTTNLEKLNFDRDKFLKAYDTDRDALKQFLVGTEDSKGVLMKMEELVENALTVGYFTTTERSNTSKLSTLNTKIERATASVDRYKRRLESKFQAMDLLISKMQDQYSSFLGT